MEELKKYCRYFGVAGGEDKNALACFYEEKWVSVDGKYPTDEYIEAGLEDFNVSDGVPISFKALLFNRYKLSNGFFVNLNEMFKQWYLKFYLCEQNIN